MNRNIKIAKITLRYAGFFVAAVIFISTLLFLLVTLPFFSFVQFGVLTAPFTGFTFTDTLDFAPVGIIVFALSSLAVRPYPEVWIRFARRTAYVMAVLPPMIYLAALYGAAWCAAQVLGHFPQPMIDDPGNIVPHAASFQMMRHVVAYTEAFAGAGVWSWAALILHLRRRLTVKDWALLVGLFVTAWLIFMGEPGRLFEWWLD